jgi:hypothetical protein
LNRFKSSLNRATRHCATRACMSVPTITLPLSLFLSHTPAAATGPRLAPVLPVGRAAPRGPASPAPCHPPLVRLGHGVVPPRALPGAAPTTRSSCRPRASPLLSFLLPPQRGAPTRTPSPLLLHWFKRELTWRAPFLLSLSLSLHIESVACDPSCINVCFSSQPDHQSNPISDEFKASTAASSPLSELHPLELPTINRPPRLTSCRPPVLQDPLDTADDHQSSVATTEHCCFLPPSSLVVDDPSPPSSR